MEEEDLDFKNQDALCRFDERVTLLVRSVCPRSVSSYIEVEYAVSFRGHVHESSLFQASPFFVHTVVLHQ